MGLPVSTAVTTPAMVPLSGVGALGPVSWARAASSGSSAHNGTKSERQRPLGVTAVGRFTSILPVDGIPVPRATASAVPFPVMAITGTAPEEAIVDDVATKARLGAYLPHGVAR